MPNLKHAGVLNLNLIISLVRMHTCTPVYKCKRVPVRTYTAVHKFQNTWYLVQCTAVYRYYR
eukprot:SAG31_NODE_10760_length_1101_cov_0.993014_1_plen_62_part_00